MMRRLFTLIFILTISFNVQAADLTAAVTLDRDTGLLIGDKITAVVHLPVAAESLDMHVLPQREKRKGAWLYISDFNLVEKTLTIHYQVVNVPAENRVVKTPEFQLRTKDGQFITVLGASLQIGSFLVENDNGEAALTPHADLAAPALDYTAKIRQFWSAVVVFVFSSLIWMIWHFGLRPRQRLPFATAIFELNKMRLLRRKEASTACRHLHHAFNRSAGRVVVYSQLCGLWQACPWLEKEKAAIEQFYANSSAHFFSPSADKQQQSFNDVMALAKACRALERLA